MSKEFGGVGYQISLGGGVAKKGSGVTHIFLRWIGKIFLIGTV